MEKKILIRVDSSSTIGSGHITRCLVLANLLKKDFQIKFVSIKMLNSMIQKIEDSGFEFESISNEDIFFNKDLSDTTVVLDGYQFDSGYQKQIKKVAYKLVCLDERQDIYFHADIVINNHPSAIPSNFKKDKETIILTGINYSLLREEFRMESKVKFERDNLKKKDKTFFICFGGSDPDNFTKRVVETLLKSGYNSLNLILGLDYKHNLKYIPNDEVININVYKNLSPKEIINVMKQSNIAILPSSTIMLEAFCVGLPIISGWYEKNQEYSLSYFHNNNYLYSCGNLREDFSQKLLSALDSKIIRNSTASFKKQKELNFSDSSIKKVFLKLYA